MPLAGGSDGDRTLPSLGHVLPLGNEAKWSDLLAALIETDPGPLAKALGAAPCDRRVTVHREVAAGRANRPDIVVNVDGNPWAVIEVKVLSGQGRAQLARYREAVSGAAHYAVVYPERLGIDVDPNSAWERLPWEQILNAYTTSENRWVAETSTAWLAHLLSRMPTVGPDTVWNDLTTGEDFVIALRSRMAWIHAHLDVKPPIEHDLVESSAGVSWVVRMYVPAARDGYRILVEAEERLGVRDFPKYAGGKPVIGPSLFVGLQQINVTTSAGYDWNYLLAMWPTMNAARTDCVTNRPRPQGHDRDGYDSIVAKGAPLYLGIGFGQGQIRHSHACMFGARLQLQPDVTLHGAAEELQGIAPLLEAMARVP